MLLLHTWIASFLLDVAWNNSNKLHLLCVMCFIIMVAFQIMLSYPKPLLCNTYMNVFILCIQFLYSLVYITIMVTWFWLSHSVCVWGGEVFLELCIIETLVFIQNQVNKSWNSFSNYSRLEVWTLSCSANVFLKNNLSVNT